MENKEGYLFRMTKVEPVCPFTFKQPLTLEMAKDENWVVYGKNGSGKNFLTETIRSSFRLKTGCIDYDFTPSSSNRVSENIQYVTFHDQYGDSNEPTFYQLRWNQGLINDDQPTVGNYLKELYDSESPLRNLLNVLQLDELQDKQIMMLSSGEFRRFQIAHILLRCPRLLILDNPFIGLDEKNRKQVSLFLQTMMKHLPLQIIVTTSRMFADLSGFTHIIYCDGKPKKIPVNEFLSRFSEETSLPEQQRLSIQRLFQKLPSSSSLTIQEKAQILELRNVTIQYGKRTILKHLNWCVHYGEKWALEGVNGSGKSTLLSLICADNPQAYACDITLFGFKRGSGESIWDIKKHIGYVSPEMYRFYRKVAPVKKIVASGLYEHTGLYRNFSEEDYRKIDFWLQLFGILELKERNYMHLSGGEQRLVLLVRAFVKDPGLLILDEPFHGLDSHNRQLALEIIEQFCNRPDKTLIMVSHYKQDFPSCITHHLQLQKQIN